MDDETYASEQTRPTDAETRAAYEFKYGDEAWAERNL